MKFAFSSVVSALLVGCVAAQQAWIGAPADRTAVSAGSNITVMVTEPVNPFRRNFIGLSTDKVHGF